VIVITNKRMRLYEELPLRITSSGTDRLSYRNGVLSVDGARRNQASCLGVVAD